jgi:hypothetical protein
MIIDPLKLTIEFGISLKSLKNILRHNYNLCDIIGKEKNR